MTAPGRSTAQLWSAWALAAERLVTLHLSRGAPSRWLCSAQAPCCSASERLGAGPQLSFRAPRRRRRWLSKSPGRWLYGRYTASAQAFSRAGPSRCTPLSAGGRRAAGGGRRAGSAPRPGPRASWRARRAPCPARTCPAGARPVTAPPLAQAGRPGPPPSANTRHHAAAPRRNAGLGRRPAAKSSRGRG